MSNGNLDTGIKFFIKEDILSLEKKIRVEEALMNQKKKDLNIAQQQSNKSQDENATSVTSGLSLDNYNSTLVYLVDIRETARVLSPQKNNGRVAMGRSIIIKNTITKEKRYLRIGSFMIFPEENSYAEGYEEMSYPSNLAQMLIGAEKGDIRTGLVVKGEPEESFKILKIT